MKENKEKKRREKGTKEKEKPSSVTRPKEYKK